MGSGGILHRQSSGYLMIRAFITSASGANVSTGNAVLRLYQILEDGSLASYDFTDNTFKTSSWGSTSVNMTHRTGYTAEATGLWTYRLPIASIVNHASSIGVLIATVNHTSAFPVQQAQEFSIGGADGDIQLTTTTNYVKAELSSTSDSIKPWGVYCPSSYDHELKKVSLIVHAEREGAAQKIKNATVQLYDSTGTLVASASGTVDPAGKDFFSLTMSEVTVTPDQAYFLKTTIVDMDDVARVAGNASVTFD